VSEHDWEPIVRSIEALVRPAGLDLVAPFQPGWYNDVVSPVFHLPACGGRDALAVLIANSKAIWQPFIGAIAADPDLFSDGNPLDRYVREAVEAAIAAIGLEHEVRYAADRPPRRVAIQHAADVSGLAPRGPGRLNIHPMYGPWIGLRAVVLFDVDGPEEPLHSLENPCLACESKCEAVPGEQLAWRDRLALRDVCPLGREHRFSEDQIRYHYIKDRRVLERLTGNG
jgi:methylmalonic aciduria homocystinuria type C protein